MRSWSTLITPPTVEAVPLPVFKEEHLKVSGDGWNPDLLKKLRAAIEWVERYTGRALMAQTWELAIDVETSWYQGATIALPKKPFYGTALSSFVWFDTADVEEAIEAESYWLDVRRGRIVLKDGYTWPSGMRPLRSMVITYRAGYSETDATRVPPSIVEAVCRVATHFHQNRAALLTGTISKEIEMGVRDQLAPFNENLTKV